MPMPTTVPPITLSSIQPMTDSSCEASKYWLQRLRAITPEVVHAIIASGVFDSEIQDIVVEQVALKLFGAAETKASLDAFFDAAHEAGVDLQVSVPEDTDPDNKEYVEDLAFSYVLTYANAAFLVGLAVGQQVGPHAFGNGGQR